MHTIAQINECLGAVLERLLPRILTQASRDPNSATYGSFDRDWWHYRIRDFSSSILQQAAWTVWLAADLPRWTGAREPLAQLAAAGCRFWNARAIRFGAFEEYYPWERGYPAAAFSTRAVLELVAAGVVAAADVRAGAVAAARQLVRRFEREAANQQVAGLAALARIRNIYPDLVTADAFEAQAQKTLALQQAEGWFAEYGGPDLAYLSVTLDALWDLFDATGDARFRAAAARVLPFLHACVAAAGASLGMLNARNTDYILPYGLVRFLRDGDAGERARAAWLFATLYGPMDQPDHFLHAVDDRYLCHYTGHSLLRAWSLVRRLDAVSLSAPPPAPADESLLPAAGYFLRPASPSEYAVALALNKGGVFTAVLRERRISDFGWVVHAGGRQCVTHWWAGDGAWQRAGQTFTVRGQLMPHRETISSPWKHAALRAASLALGEQLMPRLKALLIFKRRRSPYTFERQIALEPCRIVVRDALAGLPADARVEPAPRSSKRHVSSADSFHCEDLRLATGVAIERKTQRAGRTFTAETVYTFERGTEERG